MRKAAFFAAWGRIREKMKKKIIIAGICIIALCAVIVPKFTKPKQFAQAVALPVMDAENLRQEISG